MAFVGGEGMGEGKSTPSGYQTKNPEMGTRTQEGGFLRLPYSGHASYGRLVVEGRVIEILILRYGETMVGA